MTRAMLGLLIASASLRAELRVLQTNAAGDYNHVIDPATNQVVGEGREVKIVLVPYGSTKFHVSMFPVTGKAWTEGN